jgi:hypothetical protein
MTVGHRLAFKIHGSMHVMGIAASFAITVSYLRKMCIAWNTCVNVLNILCA